GNWFPTSVEEAIYMNIETWESNNQGRTDNSWGPLGNRGSWGPCVLAHTQ
ncbi:unnamed protein product, partial [Staurois parvus]